MVSIFDVEKAYDTTLKYGKCMVLIEDVCLFIQERERDLPCPRGSLSVSLR